jgi:DNA-binding MarR family transcriptional regulator
LVAAAAAASEKIVDSNLTIAVLRALRRILRAAELGNRQLATTTGLTPSQLLVLKEIGERGEVTPTELSAALQFGQATITNIVDRLEQRGLVARQRGEQDKRRIHLSSTQAGERAIEQAPDLLQARFSEDFARLPEWEQAMILAGLTRLAEILGVARSDAAPLLDSGVIDRASQ